MRKIEYILDRNIFDESIKEIAEKKTVLDIGAGSPFRKELSKYKPLFENCYYYSSDIRFYPQLSIISDVQEIPFKDESSDAVICSGVIHLVFEPYQAIKEIYRVLKKGGAAFFYVPFLYPYHGAEEQKDLYRFSKDGLIYLFRDFSEIKLQPIGNYIDVALNFLTGFKFNRALHSKFGDFAVKSLERIISLTGKKEINPLHNPSGFNLLVKK